MPPPLSDGRHLHRRHAARPSTSMRATSSAFLMWTAEPHLVERKRIGFQVIIFLLVFAGLMYSPRRGSGRTSPTSRTRLARIDEAATFTAAARVPPGNFACGYGRILAYLAMPSGGMRQSVAASMRAAGPMMPAAVCLPKRQRGAEAIAQQIRADRHGADRKRGGNRGRGDAYAGVGVAASDEGERERGDAGAESSGHFGSLDDGFLCGGLIAAILIAGLSGCVSARLTGARKRPHAAHPPGWRSGQLSAIKAPGDAAPRAGLMTADDIKSLIRTIPDLSEARHPVPRHHHAHRRPAGFAAAIDGLVAPFAASRSTSSPASRRGGSSSAAPSPWRLACGFIPIRKKGKLPARTSQEYASNTASTSSRCTPMPCSRASAASWSMISSPPAARRSPRSISSAASAPKSLPPRSSSICPNSAVPRARRHAMSGPYPGQLRRTLNPSWPICTSTSATAPSRRGRCAAGCP